MQIIRRGDLRRLALVTDAWHPQTNGVVNTLSRLVAHLEAHDTEVLLITPEGHRTFPLPGDPDYRLAFDPWKAITRIRAFAPDAVHIATEGPLGFWTNSWLRRRALPFTTSFHTRFPEYINARFPIPVSWGYVLERWFHRPAVHTLVGTQSLIRELDDRRIAASSRIKSDPSLAHLRATRERRSRREMSLRWRTRIIEVAFLVRAMTHGQPGNVIRCKR